MIKAIPDKPGCLRVHDPAGREHQLNVHTMGKPQEVSAGTTYIPLQDGPSLFVHCPRSEVVAAAKQARVLHKAELATERRAQLAFDFHKETAAQLPTETAAANTHQADEVRNAGS